MKAEDKQALIEFIQGSRVFTFAEQARLEKQRDAFTLAALTTPPVLSMLQVVEALEAFAHQQRVMADTLTDHEAQRSHRITACRVEDFAKQLRAGEPS